MQLFRYVQASQFACLPDRSYRCQSPRRAAETFTSEQNVRRYLRTHRICYPPDHRQLAERGLAPRKIRSFVGCSHPCLPSCWSHGKQQGLFAPRTLLRFVATAGPSATLSSSTDFPGFLVIRLPAPPISRRDEEGFSSCLTCPCHRAAPTTPPECFAASVSLRQSMLPSP